MSANTIGSFLLDVVIEEAPDDMSGRYPGCPPTGCWSHRVKPAQKGYRQPSFRGRGAYLHRLVYEALRGPIPEGLQLDHLCRNRGCCNPDHLEPVSSRENILRGETIPAACAAKTHCLNGHPLSGGNLVVLLDGRRNCRECRKDACRRYYLRNRKP